MQGNGDESAWGQHGPSCRVESLKCAVSGGKEMRRRKIARGLFAFAFLASNTVGCGGKDTEPVNTAAGTAAGPVAWTQIFGGTGEQMGWHVATTDSGQIVVAGTMQSRVDFGAGGQIDSVSDNDIFIAWINPDGKVARVRRFGESGGHIPTGIAVDSGGGVLLSGVMIGSINFGGGQIDSQGGADAFLASFSANGDYRFAISVGNASEQSGGQIAMAPDGSILWSGSFEGDVNVGGIALKSAGASDMFVAKINGNGKAAWAKALGAAGYDGDTSIAVMPQGQVLISGRYEGIVDLGDGALPATGMGDGQFLVQLKSDGSFGWSRGMGNDTGYFPYSVHVDEKGSPWLIGACAGEVDLFGTKIGSAGQGVALVKLGIDGKPLTSQVFVGDEVGYVHAARARGGGFVIAGDFAQKMQLAGQTLTSAGESDLFFIWVDSEGRVTRQARAGGAGEERFGAISMLPKGQVVVTGAFDGAMNVGGAAFTSNDGPDGYVLLLN
jgi:hypothetical protein